MENILRLIQRADAFNLLIHRDENGTSLLVDTETGNIVSHSLTLPDVKNYLDDLDNRRFDSVIADNAKVAGEIALHAAIEENIDDAGRALIALFVQRLADDITLRGRDFDDYHISDLDNFFAKLGVEFQTRDIEKVKEICQAAVIESIAALYFNGTKKNNPAFARKDNSHE